MATFEVRVNVIRVYSIYVEAPDEDTAIAAGYAVDTGDLHKYGNLEFVESEYVEVYAVEFEFPFQTPLIKVDGEVSVHDAIRVGHGLEHGLCVVGEHDYIYVEAGANGSGIFECSRCGKMKEFGGEDA